MKQQPRDMIGRSARPLRYPIRLSVKLSQDAYDTLQEMAAEQEKKGRKAKVMKIMRRAIMKDIYIYKREKEKREAREGIK